MPTLSVISAAQGKLLGAAPLPAWPVPCGYAGAGEGAGAVRYLLPVHVWESDQAFAAGDRISPGTEKGGAAGGDRKRDPV